MTEPTAQLATLRVLLDATADPALRVALGAAIMALESSSERTHTQSIGGDAQVGAAVAGDVRGNLQNIDAKHLNAGGSISILQQSGTFYFFGQAQDRGALPRVSRDDIIALLTKLQDDTVPLACYIAESLSFATKLENHPLEKFCRQELSGWQVEPNIKVETGDKYPEYRVVTAYIGPVRINLEHPAWQENIDNVIEFMGRNENFTRFSLFEPDPIATVEARVTASTGKRGFMVSEKKMGEMIPHTSTPNVTLYQYFEIREYDKVLRAIRNELNAHLLKLLREVES